MKPRLASAPSTARNRGRCLCHIRRRRRGRRPACRLKSRFESLPYCGKLGDAEIVRTVVGAISESLVNQLRDEVRHLRNMLGGAHQRGLLNADHRGIFEKCLLILRSVLLHAHAVTRRVADDLVVDVGDVHDVAHGVSALPKKSAQQVDGDEGAEIADVAVVVNGGAAGVHANFALANRAEFLHLRRHGIKKTKRHRKFRAKNNLAQRI